MNDYELHQAVRALLDRLDHLGQQLERIATNTQKPVKETKHVKASK